MRHFGWQSIAVSSLLVVALATAETRPQYGGTLHTATRMSSSSLDPADPSQTDTIARRNLLRLMFDTLVTLDGQGHPQPSVATSWRAEPGNQRWQFWLRRGLKFHDGSPVTPEAVAASLRVANPAWNVLTASDSIIIERDTSAPDTVAELARPRNGIAKRTAGGNVVGIGPFRISNWQPGKKLVLSADEGYWDGRAFLDSIEIDLGTSGRDQLIALELGKADIAEITSEQGQRTLTDGRRVVTSAPVELMALVFSRDRQTAEESKFRDALTLSIDRTSIRNVVLQGSGDTSSAILPNWVSGYSFVFPTEQNLARARQEMNEIGRTRSLTLGYDPGDTTARVIAERIALNARDAGIMLQTSTTQSTDIRLVRMTLASLNARVALSAVAAITGTAPIKTNNGSIEELFQSESSLLQMQRLIPLFQLPVSYGLSSNVRNWSQDRDGTWHLENVWLGSGKP